MKWFAPVFLSLLLLSSWTELGGSGSGSGIDPTSENAKFPSLAVDGTGHPWVAWEELKASVKSIQVRRWDGAVWTGVGGSDSVAGMGEGSSNEQPSLVLDSLGRPVVSWTHTQALYVRHWDGSAWVGYGNSDSNNGLSGISAFLSKVRLDSLDRPTVVWQFAPPTIGDRPQTITQIHLKRWKNNSWEELDGSATGGGLSNALTFSEAPDLAIGADGNPVVVWAQTDDPNQGNFIYLKRWTGSAWEELGGSASGGGINGFGGRGYSPSLALDSIGNPVVSWVESGPSAGWNPDVFLRRWNGNYWETLGWSAFSGGISNAGSAGARNPSLRMGPSDRPIVAWSTGPAFSSDEIYVKTWDGTAWVELAGSASGGGVSNTPSVSSSYPQLALTSTGEPAVAWLEGWSGITNSNGKILYRQLFDPPPAPILAVLTMDPSPAAVVEDPPPVLRITLTRAPDPLTINGVSVVLTGAGKDRVLGTADDVEFVPQVSVSGAQITLDLRALKLGKGTYRLRLRGTDGFGPGGAVRDGSGALLDGEYTGTFPSGDGNPGGDFVVDLTFGKTPPSQH